MPRPIPRPSDQALEQSLDHVLEQALDQFLERVLEQVPDQSLDQRPEQGLDRSLEQSLDRRLEQSLGGSLGQVLEQGHPGEIPSTVHNPITPVIASTAVIPSTPVIPGAAVICKILPFPPNQQLVKHLRTAVASLIVSPVHSISQGKFISPSCLPRTISVLDMVAGVYLLQGRSNMNVPADERRRAGP